MKNFFDGVSIPAQLVRLVSERQKIAFGAEFTPELREQEDRIRAKATELKKQ